MRRVELVRAVRNVLHALRVSRVHDALQETGRGARDAPAREALLTALRAYTVLSADFGDAERRVLTAMDLEALDDPAWWARIVGGAEDETRRAAATMAQAIRMAGSYLPRLVGLVGNEALRRGAGGVAPPPVGEDGMALLEVVLIGGERQRSTPLRLMTTLESIWLLYDVAATLAGVPADTLSVAAADGDENLSYDFLGRAPAVAGVKEILVSVWDRVVFYRGRQVEVRGEMIERSVPVINRIARLREAGEVGPEQAELMRRRVVAGVKKFLEAGCTIPEIEASERHEARELLAPSPRLLTGGAPE